MEWIAREHPGTDLPVYGALYAWDKDRLRTG